MALAEAVAAVVDAAAAAAAESFSENRDEGDGVIELYYAPGAASLAPHLTLEEVGAEYRLVEVKRDGATVLEPANYLQINPHGRIPALTDGELRMHESAAIVMYLAERHPEAGLAPALGSAERPHWYRWHCYLTNTVQPTFIDLFGAQRAFGGDADEAAVAALQAGAAVRLRAARQWIAGELASGGPFVLGERLSSVDLFLCMLVRWGRRLDEPWWDEPVLGELYRTITARPAARRVWEQEGLTE